MDELDELEGEKKLDVFKEQDEELERIITLPPTQSNPDYLRDDAFSQRGNKSRKNAVIIKEGTFHKLANEPDQYELVPSQGQPKSPCHFCNRDIDNHTLVGPFVKEEESLFFHLACLEANSYVRYDKKLQKWENISFAVKHLVEEKQYTCYRCLLPGSTIQCNFCDRSFHGHLCNEQYMMAIDYSNEQYVCLFCKNT